MRRVVIALTGLLLLTLSGNNQGDTEGTICPVPGGPSFEARLHALELENGCLDDQSAAGGRGAGAPGVNDDIPRWPPGWDKATIAGGDVAPVRVVSDPYPTLHSVVVDSERNLVFMSDPNRHALWSYDRLAASKGREAVEPLTGIRGPSTGMMFVAAVTIDRERQEIYSVDNDIGDRMMVFPYDANGNVKPKRVLEVPHQAWGLSISPERDEIAVSVESPREVVIYRRGAEGHEQPRRIIRGPKTGIGDPHGVFFDGQNNEIVLANHGNQGGRPAPPGDAPGRQRGVRPTAPQPIEGGRFDEPSITVFNADAHGDVAPLRKIQG